MTGLKYLLAVLALTNVCNAVKVLVSFPFPGKSHSILGEGHVRVLAEAGHEVTFVTPFVHDNLVKLPNVRIIDVSKVMEESLFGNLINVTAIMTKEVDVNDMSEMFRLLSHISRRTLENENLQKLLNDPAESFDVIIVEWMFSEVFAGFQAVFNCPYIWFSSVEPHSAALRLIDESLNTAYNPDAFSLDLPPFDFVSRAQQLFRLIFSDVFRSYYFTPMEAQFYKEFFGPVVVKKGRVLPPFEAVVYNASLMLGNSHVSLGQPTRLPQNYKAIAGYHIDPKIKPLQEDLKTIIDNAKNGLIYFSMGSNLKSKDLPDSIKKDILKMFSELKYTVLWKFEETFKNLPNNVHVLKWAPQTSILSHPNCKLFITHGGLLSTTETVYFGVPVIGIPVFGDQFININRAVGKGFAKKVDLSFSLVKDLKMAITEIMADPRYAQRVKELSVVFHDRPVSPGAELVHWVEHVVRTRGAPHLRSPALHVPLYQKMYLDLAALLFFALVFLRYLCKHVCTLLCSLNNNFITNKKKNN